MLIDVIIATYNRAALLERAVRSILAAHRPPGCDFVVTVVDNNSSDETARTVERLMEDEPARVRYLFEARQGKSYAVNMGIAATDGDAVAFADDDQLMSDDWLCAIQRALGDGFDYVTGPVIGEWLVAPPPWYDDRLRGALSLFDGGTRRMPYSLNGTEGDFGMAGGNSAIRRAALTRVGGYRPELGKLAGTFTMCEDSELFLRLKQAGFRGLYEPHMVVHHLVPGERVTKDYFRRWYRGNGWAAALIDTLHPQAISYWLGVPRFLVRRTLEAVPRMIRAGWRRDLPGIFEQELCFRFLLGFIAGKREVKSKVKSQKSKVKAGNELPTSNF